MTRPRINDGLSRQRRWQLRKQGEGLCTLCGKGKLVYAEECEDCRTKKGIAQNGRESKGIYNSKYNRKEEGNES